MCFKLLIREAKQYSVLSCRYTNNTLNTFLNIIQHCEQECHINITENFTAGVGHRTSRQH